MKDEDFAKAQLYLFEQEFGQNAKEALHSADVLRKMVYQQTPNRKANYQGGYSCTSRTRAKGMAATATMALVELKHKNSNREASRRQMTKNCSYLLTYLLTY